MAKGTGATGPDRTHTGPKGAEKRETGCQQERAAEESNAPVSAEQAEPERETPEAGNPHTIRVKAPDGNVKKPDASGENHAQPGQFGVHGVQTKRDWPCLTLSEVETVLGHYFSAPSAVRLMWHSMRPFSAAARVDVTVPEEAAGHPEPPDGQNAEGGERLHPPKATFILKRHHASLRTAAALEEEHAFMRHLAGKSVPVCLPLATRSGPTALEQGEWTYELFPPAPGQDAYRDVMSWKPYHSAAHAHAAGQALARLHLAAYDYAAPSRGEGTVPATGGSAEKSSYQREFSKNAAMSAGRPLTSSMNAIAQPDLLPALRQWVQQQAGLPEQLASRPWEADVQAIVGPFHAQLRPLLSDVRSCWGHGDWHGSNLFWQEQEKTEGRVACVLDFGMAERTCIPFDLAVAIERSMIDWLDLSRLQGVVAYAQLEAFLEGYCTIRPLTAAEWAQLVAFLPLVHVEFALSEVAYFGSILQDKASTEVAYTDYLLGHARWFAGPEGQALLAWLAHYPERHVSPGKTDDLSAPEGLPHA